MCPAVVNELYKVASINLCPNVPGQVAVGLMCQPPKPGDHSYAQFTKEKGALIQSLKRRARMMTDAFNSLEGVVCQETEGNLNTYFMILLKKVQIHNLL